MTYQVPPGYTLVPNEATIEMCKAMPTLAEVNVEDLVGEWKPREIQNKKRWEAAIRFVREHGLAPAQAVEAMSFDRAWQEQYGSKGYQYSGSALEKVRMGYELAQRVALQPHQTEPEGGPSPAPAHAEALRLADAIDPFTRKEAPDHLTSKVAADALRRLAAQAPAVAPEPLTDERIKALAHRSAWRYKKAAEGDGDTYTFNETTLLQFAAALAASGVKEADHA